MKTTLPFLSKPDLVSTTLIYPMTLTTDDFSTFGLQIVGNASAPVAQQELQFRNSSGGLIWTIPVAGGPKSHACDVRCSNSVGGSYVALNASGSVPCLELADGTSSQGSKIWSGAGEPSSTTVGAATSGDYYFRLPSTAAPTLVAASYATGTSSQISVGNGTLTNATASKAGVPAVGDLLVAVACSTVATTETVTIGDNAGISADASVDDGTRRIKMYSKIIDASGDISSDQVLVTMATHNTGGQRRVAAYVFRHGNGFPASPFNTSNTDSGLAAETTENLTISGPSQPSVSVAATYQTANPATANTYRWDSGTATNLEPEQQGATVMGSTSSSKPGAGTNTSNTTGYTTGGSVVDIANIDANHCNLLGNWLTNTAAPNTVWVCTSGGSPGTWSAIV